MPFLKSFSIKVGYEVTEHYRVTKTFLNNRI